MDSLKALNDKIYNQQLKEIALSDNIQQQEKLIAALRIAQERSAFLAAIVDSSDDAIISKNLDGIITSWNVSAQRIFGYSAEEIIGQSIMTLIPEDRQDEEPLILARIRAGERIGHMETKRRTKHGKLVDVSLSISPVKDASGKIIGVSKIARDISDKKREEQRKNDFIAIVSHELKTPLTSIKSYIQLALSKVKRLQDKPTENILTRAELQTQKMTVMINDFLNLSRLEEGKMTLNLSRFSLSALLNEIVGESNVLAPDHLIEYRGCPDIEIYADRDKIGLVITNILSNATKYSQPRTTVRIDCKLVKGQVLIAFSDQGMGIAEADQQHLFERFYRVKDNKLKNISGFGIGLYLVAEILKLHGSQIQVQSEPGKGSVFSFALQVS